MKYIYLRESPSGLITSDKRTTLQVTWKDKVDGCIFYPNSTWAQCRNLLLEEALKVGYDYYIFMDSDVVLTDDEYRKFEHFLQVWKPAVGYAYYYSQPLISNTLVQTGNVFDALFNAFHKDTIGTIIPYSYYMQDESWHYSQYWITQLCNIFYGSTRLQFNGIEVQNPCHTDSYPRRLDRDKIFDRMLEGVRQKYRYLVRHPLNDEIVIQPIIHENNIVSIEELTDALNLTHPMFEQILKYR